MLHPMEARLYVVHGSHPCATVAKALEIKGVPFKTVELPPPMHAAIQRIRFGARTVPGLRLDDGEKVSGSRPILRRLEELRPEPPLYPADPDARAKAEEAERWGEQVFQPIPRRLIWLAVKRNPAVLVSYSEHSKLPLPAPMIRLSAPLVSRVEVRLNGASPEVERAELDALPGHLDRIDGWIAEGVLGGEQPNAADLQIAPTLRLLMTLEDVRPQIESRPAGALAQLFPQADGHLPAGSLAV
jgi:glutathione S-transferase